MFCPYGLLPGTVEAASCEANANRYRNALCPLLHDETPYLDAIFTSCLALYDTTVSSINSMRKTTQRALRTRNMVVFNTLLFLKMRQVSANLCRCFVLRILVADKGTQGHTRAHKPQLH